MPAADDGREARITIELGDEMVLLKGARCIETMGGSFDLEVDILVKQTGTEIDLIPHLGGPVAVHVLEENEAARHFHGLLVGGEFVHERKGHYSYRLLARPFTHFLAQNIDMAIFQQLSVPDIIKSVLTKAGYHDFRLMLHGSYPLRDYCVQYRESDLTFITRLMEEEGIYYFWDHQESKHEMVFCDAPASHKPGEPATLHYNPSDRGASWASARKFFGGDINFISGFGERVVTGAHGLVTLRSFDFTKPQRPVEADHTQSHQHLGEPREVFTYPAPFVDPQRGRVLASRLLDAMRSDRQEYDGVSQATGLACGRTLSVTEHPTPRLNASYLITRTEHVIENAAFWADYPDEDDGGDRHTHTVFHAIPARTPFRLPRVTPRPVVQGLETAIITGPDGEEIYTDPYGRVKVRFHWDRGVDEQGHPKPGEATTCWIRVAQFGGLSSFTLPRVGQEVMVDFLHGNPDEPIVVGWVFNQDQMPVYELPKHRARHVFRGRSYPGGQSTQFPGAKEITTKSPGANELRFDDSAGKEELFLHAEKDFFEYVRHDTLREIGRDENITVHRDRDDEVKNDEVTKIGKDQTLTVVGNQKETIEAKRTIDVKADDKLDVGMTQTIKVGTKIDISAGVSITLHVGPSKIVIDNQGVTINAPTVKIEGVASAKMTSAMTEVSGGMTTIQGGMVKINC